MQKLLFLILIAVLAPATAMAQVDSSGCKVIGAENYHGRRRDQIGLDSYLLVKAEGLAGLVRETQEGVQPVLYLDGVPMQGIKPLFLDTCGGTVVFKLTRDSASFRSWAVFYQFPISFERKMKVSLGIEGKCPVPSDSVIRVVLMRKSMLAGCLAGLAVLVILVIYLSAKTTIIRNNSPGATGAFSLARTQMAFWSVLVTFAYLYIWAVTGVLPLINGSILILLSISMGTAAGASIIDFSQKDNVPSGGSKGFLIDILSDRSGVSIHRFQMFVWTIVLGIFFYRAVIRNLAMPQFDDNLLALMGISNGAYLGLKIPENKPGAGN